LYITYLKQSSFRRKGIDTSIIFRPGQKHLQVKRSFIYTAFIPGYDYTHCHLTYRSYLSPTRYT